MQSGKVKNYQSNMKIKHERLTKTICQLGFRCGQQSSQPATTASGFDRKATRNPQLHIVPSVVVQFRKAGNILRVDEEVRVG